MFAIPQSECGDIGFNKQATFLKLLIFNCLLFTKIKRARTIYLQLCQGQKFLGSSLAVQ